MLVGQFRRSCLAAVINMFLPGEISAHMDRDTTLKHEVINHVQKSLVKAPAYLRISELGARVSLAGFGVFVFLFIPNPSRRANFVDLLFSRSILLYKVQQLYLNLALYAYFENPSVRNRLGISNFQDRANFFFEKRMSLTNGEEKRDG